MQYKANIQKEFWGYTGAHLRQGVKLQHAPKPSKANKIRKLVRYMDRCSTGK